MKSTQLKKLIIGNKISTITIEHDSTERSFMQHHEIIAIAILLGGYNQYGRKIDIDKYKEIKGRFNDCIDEVRGLL